MRNIRSILVFHPALWALIALQGAIIAIWIGIDPRISFNLTNAGQTSLAVSICLLIAAAITHFLPVSRRSAFAERARIMAVGLAFLLVAFVGIRLLNYLTMSLAFPLADEWLDSWDKLLGIDWYAYALWMGEYPDLLSFSELPYGMTIQTVGVIFVALVLFGRIERAKELVTLLFLGALITVSISGFFPATAAMVHYMDDNLRALYGANVGVYHMAAFTDVREAQTIVLNLVERPGLATFPSYHTIAGLLIVYALRDNLIMLLAGSVWSGAMLLATPILGGHYFIDIIAGTLVTVALAAAYATVGTLNFFPYQVAAPEPVP
ncbi:hypothetical protein G5V57_12965 [Nordella sp. HKS 07]|uniref:phosphatase PAP2 family protein n=1 Tax=Nordella sp. HKS 07 TaxID=2712222 RepID=UPI0013E1FEA2|nr:phosphatase PAP2 family protein [Nordella sp. HKS 07]QIG48555.1 hypothetical protein G5V57_12965 [Nordella sp. HKS 07]